MSTSLGQASLFCGFYLKEPHHVLNQGKDWRKYLLRRGNLKINQIVLIMETCHPRESIFIIALSDFEEGQLLISSPF